MVRSVLLLVCCASQLSLSAPAIRSIRLNGCAARSEHELLGAISSRPGHPYSPAALRADLASIEEIYHADGYAFASAGVDTLLFTGDSAAVDVVLGIREGDRYLVGAITIAGRQGLPEEPVRNAIATHAGSILAPEALEADIAKILTLYERAGYPFASVRVAAIEAHAETATLDVRLQIDEGARVEITEIRVEGNASTQDEVILREARMHLPELYDEEKLARISNRLRRLNLFTGVSEPKLLMSDRGGILVLRVEEGRTSTFDGIVGYAPAPQAGGSGVVAGSVNIGLRNLFGTARILNVRWQKDDQVSQDIRLQYVEPWLFHLPINLGGAFQQRQQDTSYLRRVEELQSSILLSESFSLGGSVGHEETIPSAGAGPRPVANSRTLTAGVEILFDSRNDNISPTSGIYYHNAYAIGNKKILGSTPPGASAEASALQRVSLDLQWYTSPVVRNVILVGLHGRQVTNDRLEASDLYRFGGTNTLRGYRELQFSGSRIAWTNLEYRVLLAPRSFAFGFFDSGYYFLPEDPALSAPSSQSVKYGYGVGIRLETALGNVGVSFALGGGDGLSQGKIHFGLINEF